MTENRIYYAIGDVHGECARLHELHEKIFDRHRRKFKNAPMTLVHVGDYVDRGPDSRGVIETLMGLEARAREDDGLEVVNLKGNHDQMMVDAVGEAFEGARRHWLVNGGVDAVRSYRADGGVGDGEDWGAIEDAHIQWINGLATVHRVEARKLVFVHAGIDPQTFPDCDEQVRMWTRSEKFFDTKKWPEREELSEILVIHGHTPTENGKPDIEARRINIDTGAVYGGPLTAVILAPDKKPKFLTA